MGAGWRWPTARSRRSPMWSTAGSTFRSVPTATAFPLRSNPMAMTQPGPNSQILTVAQMRAAEEKLIAAGTSVDALMLTAGTGAAEWVYRLAWPRPVTVLCGPGNNGGDGYVIAEALRRR